MTETWTLQDAKSHFSEVFERTFSLGPQRVTRRGKDAIILLSEDQYDALCGKHTSFIDFLLSAPKIELSVSRTKDFGREVEL